MSAAIAGLMALAIRREFAICQRNALRLCERFVSTGPEGPCPDAGWATELAVAFRSIEAAAKAAAERLESDAAIALAKAQSSGEPS